MNWPSSVKSWMKRYQSIINSDGLALLSTLSDFLTSAVLQERVLVLHFRDSLIVIYGEFGAMWKCQKAKAFRVKDQAGSSAYLVLQMLYLDG